ncbi:MAG: RecQ family zinc-binding domain-containing protein, partial [Rhodothermia bacterium]|nr:RecQ family zinc-binding domain-containing protein [Rhodothermia bacterium]
HSFRPAYLEIADALEVLGRPPIVALTATATPAVQRDIVASLRLETPIQVAGGFDRPNIVWSVFRNQNKRRRVESVLRGVEGSGILYASTRHEAEQWAGWLAGMGVTAEAYHAGVPRQVRDDRQTRWMSGELRVIAATSAFGMGIDKADVRFVVHVNVPGSLEAYYQEAGRAGRDARKSYAVLLYNDGDEAVQEALIRRSYPDVATIRAVYDGICSIARIPVGARGDGPSMVMEDAAARAASCDVADVRGALGYLDRQGVVSLLDDRNVSGYVMIRNLPAIRALAALDSGETVARVAIWVLRNERLLESERSWASLSTDAVSEQTGLEASAVAGAFDYLSETGSLDWRPATEGTVFVLSEPRQQRLGLDKKKVGRGRRAGERRLREMVSYANTRACRREYLLAYFGETPAPQCGRCDVCIDRDAGEPSTAERDRLAREVVSLIKSGHPRQEWVSSAGVEETALAQCLDWLIREGYVRTSPDLDGSFELTQLASKIE